MTVLIDYKNAKEYIKTMTNIPNEFIDDIFAFYNDDTLQTDFVINLEIVAKWLGARKGKLAETLRRSYKKNVDFIVRKATNVIKKDPRANNNKDILITPDCFKRLCMLSRSKKGETVRSYFIEIENTFIKYRKYTAEGIMLHMKRQKKYPTSEKGFVYVICVNENKHLYKPGSTQDMNKRMSTYRTGREHDIQVVYLYETDNIRAIETCLKGWLAGTRYLQRKEIYQVELNVIKKLITECSNIGTKLHIRNKLPVVEPQDGGYYVAFKHVSSGLEAHAALHE